jgi:hypothetical protein
VTVNKNRAPHFVLTFYNYLEAAENHNYATKSLATSGEWQDLNI